MLLIAVHFIKYFLICKSSEKTKESRQEKVFLQPIIEIIKQLCSKHYIQRHLPSLSINESFVFFKTNDDTLKSIDNNSILITPKYNQTSRL